MKVWRKKTGRWAIDGKRVPSGTPEATKQTIESKRFYGTLKLADGKTKQQPLTEDRESSESLLRRLQGEADRNRALGITQQDLTRSEPIELLIDDYEVHLRDKRSTEKYIRLRITRLRAVIAATKTTTLAELESGPITRLLATWRDTGPKPTQKGRKRRPLSTETSNHYVRACRGFSRFLSDSKVTPDDVLRNLKPLNSRADQRHTRRALTPQGLELLIDATLQEKTSRSGKGSLRPTDRAMLYLVAAYTGLRASELASLTRSSIDLEAATVTVQAAYSKRRRDDVLPLHASLAERLKPWLQGKTGTLWGGTWASRASKIIQRDLANASIPYRDTFGRYADFHSLRHTFISSLARNGVHPSEAKELARHSTITLTMDHYTHAETETLRASLNALPPIG